VAEENTTDLTPTTTDTPAKAPDPASSTSSTTETTPNPAPAEDEAAPGTILTGETEDEKSEDKAEDKAEDDERAALYGAPEGEYEMPELPEGMTVDTDALAAVTPIAKELNLSNEGMAKLVGVYATEIVPKVTDKVVEGIQRDVAAKHAEWAGQSVEMVKTDEAFGGKSLKEVQQVAAKALDRFFGPEAREYLQDSGLGNYPAMVKGMYLVGTQIAEDTSFDRGSTTPAPKSRTEKYYGSQT
jgi:hypothetical protein